MLNFPGLVPVITTRSRRRVKRLRRLRRLIIVNHCEMDRCFMCGWYVLDSGYNMYKASTQCFRSPQIRSPQTSIPMLPLRLLRLTNFCRCPDDPWPLLEAPYCIALPAFELPDHYREHAKLESSPHRTRVRSVLRGLRKEICALGGARRR